MTLNLAPPEGAVVLFNGKDLTNWHTRDGGPAGWQVEDGVATVVRGTGDILSAETFLDAYLHLEWMEPDMPEATGQAKGNSGVYLQGRYEIQVLDSYGWAVPGLGDCGAIYNMHAPLVNACKPALSGASSRWIIVSRGRPSRLCISSTDRKRSSSASSSVTKLRAMPKPPATVNKAT